MNDMTMLEMYIWSKFVLLGFPETDDFDPDIRYSIGFCQSDFVEVSFDLSFRSLWDMLCDSEHQSNSLMLKISQLLDEDWSCKPIIEDLWEELTLNCDKNSISYSLADEEWRHQARVILLEAGICPAWTAAIFKFTEEAIADVAGKTEQLVESLQSKLSDIILNNGHETEVVRRREFGRWQIRTYVKPNTFEDNVESECFLPEVLVQTLDAIAAGESQLCEAWTELYDTKEQTVVSTSFCIRCNSLGLDKSTEKYLLSSAVEEYRSSLM